MGIVEQYRLGYQTLLACATVWEVITVFPDRDGLDGSQTLKIAILLELILFTT